MNVESNCLIVSFGLCCLFILETSFDSHLCNGFGLCRNAKFYGSVFLYNPHYVCVCSGFIAPRALRAGCALDLGRGRLH